MASVLLHDRVEQPFLLHTVIVGACFYRHHGGIRECRAWPAGLLSRALIGSGGGDGGGGGRWRGEAVRTGCRVCVRAVLQELQSVCFITFLSLIMAVGRESRGKKT